MSLTETYSRVRVGNNVSDRFPIRNGLKQGDALSPMLFNFALEYVIRRVQVNNFNKLKFYCGRNYEQAEVRKCLLSLGAESFVFQIAIQKFNKI